MTQHIEGKAIRMALVTDIEHPQTFVNIDPIEDQEFIRAVQHVSTIDWNEFTVEIEVENVSTPMFALLSGWHVVDVSEIMEPHLVRGTQ